MQCPRDGWELRRSEIEGAPVYRCPKCNGILFELESINRLNFDLGELKAVITNTSKEGILVSPLSGQPMRVFFYRGVELDFCVATNSVWLDRGELDKISRVDVSNLHRNNASDSVIAGIDAALSGVDILDFVGDALSFLFDGL